MLRHLQDYYKISSVDIRLGIFLYNLILSRIAAETACCSTW